MGTWGTGPFENDEAADWVAELDRAPRRKRAGLLDDPLFNVVAHVEDGGWGLDAAVAAAAVVASRLPEGPQLTEGSGPARETLDTLVINEMTRSLAVEALRKILDARSEWSRLWEEAGELDEAVAGLQPILHTLEQAPKAKARTETPFAERSALGKLGVITFNLLLAALAGVGSALVSHENLARGALFWMVVFGSIQSVAWLVKRVAARWRSRRQN